MRSSSTKILAATLATVITVVGCGKKEESKEEASEQSGTPSSGGGSTGSETPVIMSGSLAIEGTALTATDRTLYCITFESVPQTKSSPFSAAGLFSVEVPRNVNFGCFVIDTVTKKNIATFIVAGSGGGLGSGNSSSIALSSSVDLGNLTIDANGLVVIPAARLANAAYAPAAAGIDIDQMHNAGYTITCIDVGDAVGLATCKENMLENEASSSVFFRILKGNLNGKTLEGLGVWANEAGFDACGSFDINQEMITKDGATLTLSQGSVGEWAGTLCAERDVGPGKVKSNLKDYYMLSELVKTGAGYSVRDEDNDDRGGGCNTYSSISIEFSGSTNEIIGAISMMYTSRGCSNNERFNESFLLKFTKN